MEPLRQLRRPNLLGPRPRRRQRWRRLRRRRLPRHARTKIYSAVVSEKSARSLPFILVPRYNNLSLEPPLSSAPTSPTPLSTVVPSKSAFYFIIVTVAFYMLPFGIIPPVLPNLILHFDACNISRAAVIT